MFPPKKFPGIHFPLTDSNKMERMLSKEYPT